MLLVMPSLRTLLAGWKGPNFSRRVLSPSGMLCVSGCRGLLIGRAWRAWSVLEGVFTHLSFGSCR